MKRLLLPLLFATLAGYIAPAQEAVPLSLDDCMNYALKHNYAIKNARLDIMIQDAQNKQVTAATLPRINGKVELDDIMDATESFLPTTAFTGSLIPLLGPLYTAEHLTPPSVAGGSQYSAVSFSAPFASSLGLTASQNLFDGSIIIALKARKTVMELARQNGEVTEENVRYNIFKAYNSLVIAYHQFDIIKNSLKYARSIEHDIIVTQQSGFAEKIEVERTAVQVNNLATDSIRVNNLLSVSAQVLKYQMGMDINTPIVLTDTNVDERKIETNKLLDEEEEYNRVPEFSLMQTQLKLNEYNVQRYQLAALPTLNLFASGGYNTGSGTFSDMFKPNNYYSNFLIGLQLNVPIFNGFMRINQVKEAKLNVEKSKNNIDNIKLTIDFQSAQSRTTLRNAILQVRSQKRNVDLAADVLDLAEKKYKAGVGSNLEVTQAQTDNLSAQNNYFSALLDLINAEADLKKALGLLK